MGSEPDSDSLEFLRQVRARVEQTSVWVREARRHADPVAWTNELAETAKTWLAQSGLPPEQALAMRLDVEDMQWAILTGIACFDHTRPAPTVRLVEAVETGHGASRSGGVGR